MLLISAEISLSPAEIAYEPNDGHLEIIKKVIKIICRNNFKECFEFNLAVLRHYCAYWAIFEPNDGHLGKFSYFPKLNIQAYFVELQLPNSVFNMTQQCWDITEPSETWLNQMMDT